MQPGDTIQVVRLTLGRTVDTKPYESVRFDITVEVPPGVDWRESMKALKAIVREQEAALRGDYAPRPVQPRAPATPPQPVARPPQPAPPQSKGHTGVTGVPPTSKRADGGVASPARPRPST